MFTHKEFCFATNKREIERPYGQSCPFQQRWLNARKLAGIIFYACIYINIAILRAGRAIVHVARSSEPPGGDRELSNNFIFFFFSAWPTRACGGLLFIYARPSTPNWPIVYCSTVDHKWNQMNEKEKLAKTRRETSFARDTLKRFRHKGIKNDLWAVLLFLFSVCSSSSRSSSSKLANWNGNSPAPLFRESAHSVWYGRYWLACVVWVIESDRTITVTSHRQPTQLGGRK